jgi:hypothetical protein
VVVEVRYSTKNRTTAPRREGLTAHEYEAEVWLAQDVGNFQPPAVARASCEFSGNGQSPLVTSGRGYASVNAFAAAISLFR